MSLNNSKSVGNNNELSVIDFKISKKMNTINTLNSEIKKLKLKKKKIIKKLNNNISEIKEFNNNLYYNQLHNFEDNSKKGHIVNHILSNMNSLKFMPLSRKREYITDSSDEDIGF